MDSVSDFQHFFPDYTDQNSLVPTSSSTKQPSTAPVKQVMGLGATPDSLSEDASMNIYLRQLVGAPTGSGNHLNGQPVQGMTIRNMTAHLPFVVKV